MAFPRNNDMNSNRQAYETMSPDLFANLGAPDLAYVRAVETTEGEAWGIFAANGTPLGSAPDRGLAFAAAVQNDLVPVSVH